MSADHVRRHARERIGPQRTADPTELVLSQQRNRQLLAFFAIALVALTGIALSLAVVWSFGTGRFTWLQAIGIVVGVNIALVLGIPCTGRHIAENVATSIVFVVLAVVWSFILKQSFTVFVPAVVLGAAGGIIANIWCQRVTRGVS
jgi:hypothetical protein